MGDLVAGQCDNEILSPSSELSPHQRTDAEKLQEELPDPPGLTL